MSAKKPILYGTPRSPPCRAVSLTAAALGVELEYVEFNLMNGDHMTPEYLKMNPQHTIPCLNDNGVIIADSHVICSYLVDTYGKDDSLYPKDPAKRRLVNTRMNFNCGHLWPRLRLIVEPVIYLGERDIAAFYIDYMVKAYDGVERCLQSSTYLAGDNLTIADLCCLPTLTTAHRFAPVDATKYPKLAAWLQRLSQLPYFNEVNVEGCEQLEKRVRKIIEDRKQAN